MAVAAASKSHAGSQAVWFYGAAQGVALFMIFCSLLEPVEKECAWQHVDPFKNVKKNQPGKRSVSRSWIDAKGK
jgi:hypothetical protein